MPRTVARAPGEAAVGVPPQPAPPGDIAEGPAAPSPATGGWLEELRYLLFGCAAPAALFGMLGWYNLVRLHSAMLGPERTDTLWEFMTGPLQRALYLAFVSIPVAIYITRP